VGPVKVLGQHSLERATRAAGIDARPVWLEQTGSTNDDARRLAKEGAPEWTVVAAGHQTTGRGRLGRSWTDAPGRALLFSLLVRPARPPEQVPQLGLLAAVELIASAGHPGMRAKWPNDLVVGDRKIGGILLEAAVAEGRLSHVVVGVGVNVTMTEADFPDELRSSATSFLLEGMRVDDQIQETLLSGFLAGFRRCAELPAGEIVEEYRGVCATLGRPVRATVASGEVVEGLAVGLDERGSLVLDREGGRKTVVFGEVTHLR
jgi:BirA family biotin operon repressor/biotin-[acetyl-CoA-carboxylase] ligase